VELSAMTLSPISNPFNWPPALGFRLREERSNWSRVRLGRRLLWVLVV
jgi:hypothetical protein